MNLEQKANELRHTVLDMCERAKTGHVTSSFSCVEILVALYYRILNTITFVEHGEREYAVDGDIVKQVYPYPSERIVEKSGDRFILSKAQASPILYAILADLGYFDKALLDTWCQKDGFAGVHLQVDVPGAEITAGSLGHGFGIAAGMALANRMDMKKGMVYTLLGDGELYEGSIWETAMFAGARRLNNLVAIVDRNSVCATNRTEESVSLEPIDKKFKAFGWDVFNDIDGQDLDEMINVLTQTRHRYQSKPVAIIAYTVKGYPIDFISDDARWHARALTGDDYEKAKGQLDAVSA